MNRKSAVYLIALILAIVSLFSSVLPFLAISAIVALTNALID